MIAQELEVSLHMAFVEARQKRHEFITVEHLLLALLDNPSAAEVLRACGAEIDELRRELTNFINEHTPRIEGSDEIDTQPTLGFQRVIQRAILHVQSSGKKEVTGANVLVAIFGEKDSHAVYYLQRQNISRLDVVDFISHGIAKAPPQGAASQSRSESEQGEQESDEKQAGGALESYTQNLNQQALVGKIDPLIGREKEVERVIQDPVPPAQEQSPARGRGRCRQNRNCRRSRAPYRRGPGARDSRERAGLRPRHGRPARRHQVSGRLRAASEGGAEAAHREPERDPLHRRDPHLDRRGRGLGRHAGCFQPAQACAVLGPAEVHWRDHLQRVPPDLREGPRAVAALPEDRRGRAVGGRDGRDPQGPQEPLRGASRHQVLELCAVERSRAVRQVHQRPPPSGQGDRRHRRSRRSAAHPAEVEAEEDHRPQRDRGDRRQDRPHPAAHRVERRQGRAEDAGARPQERGVRSERRDRGTGQGDQDVALGSRQSAEAHRLLPVLGGRPVSARPRSRASSPTRWASNWCASTCPSTWSVTR